MPDAPLFQPCLLPYIRHILVFDKAGGMHCLKLLVIPIVFSFPIDLGLHTVRYDHHKIVRFPTTPETLRLVQEHDYDLWKCSKDELHVRVTSSELAQLERFEHSILVEDIQREIDREATGQRLSKRDLSAWHTSYHSYDEIMDWLHALAEANPGLVSLNSSIGKSIEGRDIPALHLTSNNGKRKSQFWLQGLQHAREWISGSSMQYLADALVTGYSNDPSIRWMLNNFEIIILPVTNPDGYDYTWTTDRLWRKNRRLVKENVYGVDLNRNWPDHWGLGGSSHDPTTNTYLGASPGSEPEVVSLMKHYLRQPRIIGAIDFHSYGELIMWPFGWTHNKSPWDKGFAALGEGMRAAISAVNPKNRYAAEMDATLYIASGGADDWFFGEEVSKKQGFVTTGLTVELSPASDSPSFILPPERILPVGKEVLAMVQYFISHVYKNPAPIQWHANGNSSLQGS
ncbi:hypothetical protein K493DRAFT_301197 [Basidiobolus meristosporus CBS 931.73]|uniref:Peptidase M14 domain-containing protein n=1 Tax=Basidiobolus meristosporus CBS 931.73 TaxID=1314790 RepID=A0A1Y1YD39_9FUNG|nr:hypothetical protein K493DRAFT_301197 [Basidiobolus meristosporus CBS 931.73]|eukprot:ORX95897.1 hypothetical protein K493DRAFT_301197 [Basidiobolus meristosporus CBS 931.73]